MMNWAYIAGFFDGEGNVNYHHAFPNVNLSQTAAEGKALLEEIRKFLASHEITGTVRCYSKTKYYGNKERKAYRGNGLRSAEWANIYRFDITNRKSVVRFLQGVLPFVRIKKVQSQDCLRYALLFPQLTKNKFWLDERVSLMNSARKAKYNQTLEVL